MTAGRIPRTYWEYDACDPVRCDRCGWSGVTSPDDTEAFLDVRCPECDGPILKISWPTRDETQAAADAGDPRAREELGHVQVVEDRWARASRVALKGATELPPVDGHAVELTWDQAEADGEQWTVVRNGDRELFRELAYWEGIDRFLEVVSILRQAYGPRLRAVTPTSASETYLFGDALGAPRQVEAVNAELRSGAG